MEYIIRILPALLDGAIETIKIFLFTLVLALPAGVPIALGALSKRWTFKAFSNLYVLLFRGTPLMLQLYFVYYALPLFSPLLTLDRFSAAILTFVLNYAAYFSEIYRAGIQSIDKGQSEACVSLGFSKVQTMRIIILPQVIQRIIPPVSNEVITLVKDTALVAAIAVPELLKSARDAANRDVNPTAFVVVAVFYLILTALLTFVSRMLEKRFSRHEKEAM